MASKLQTSNERIVIITGPRGSAADDSVSSISRLANCINELLSKPEEITTKKELVIAGGWTFAKDTTDVLQAKFGKLDLESAVDTETDEPLRTGDLSRARSQSSAAQKNTLQKHELEWSLAISFIKSILEKIQGLRSLEWETDLPFSKEIWPVIPDNIQKLSLNMFVPDGEDLDFNEPHPDYFTHDDLMNLGHFQHLKSLRIYNMADSFQSILWEAVWKNPGLITLELGMRDNPITRDSDNAGKPMPVIDANWKYNAKRVATDTYRGREGAGMLHHLHGHGEYLDHVAISKARNAVMYGMGELKSMPMMTLRLSNFVVDDTSLSKYFDGLRKIVFCQNCVDAGFVLPENLKNKVHIFTRASGLGELVDGGETELEVKTVGEDAA